MFVVEAGCCVSGTNSEFVSFDAFAVAMWPNILVVAAAEAVFCPLVDSESFVGSGYDILSKSPPPDFCGAGAVSETGILALVVGVALGMSLKLLFC